MSTTDDPTDDPRTSVADLLALGVPWPLAREAIASTRLDRDQTHTLDEPS